MASCTFEASTFPYFPYLPSASLAFPWPTGPHHAQVLYGAQKVARTINCHHTCFQLEDADTYDRRICDKGCFETPPA